jgi:hypothetical protein
MKKLPILLFTLAFMFFGTLDSPIMAQGKAKGHAKVKKSGGPPSWAPAHGYRAKTRHVFFKEYDVYYDLEKSVYISLSGSSWVVSAQIPVKLASVNLGAAVQVEIDLEMDDPQKYYSKHKN